MKIIIKGLSVCFKSKGWMLTFSMLVMFILVLSGCGNVEKTTNKETAAASNPPAATAPPVNKGPAKIVVTYFPYADHLFALGKADAVAGVVNLKSLADFPVYDSF